MLHVQPAAVPGWAAWGQMPRMAPMSGRAAGAAGSAPPGGRVVVKVTNPPKPTRGHHSTSPSGPRIAHADGAVAQARANGVYTSSHSAVVAGGRPFGGLSPAAQTTRNRPPPQDYVMQQGLYRRPHHSLPPGSGPAIQVQQQVQQVKQLQQSSPQLPQSKAPETQLSQLPVQYNFGGSTASGKRKEKQHGPSAEYSDDDELGPNISFGKKKLSLLVRCISLIHQEITSQEEMSPEAMELRKLYAEEQYHISCQTDSRGWRRSLGDTNPVEVANFILGLFENGFFEVSELICCLIFLRRFREKTGLRMDPACWRPLFVAALLVTDKYLIDSSVKGSSMSEQSMFPVLTPSQVFALELTFWKKLDFGRLWLTRRDFKAFCQELELHVPESMDLARFVKSHNYVKSETFTWGENSQIQELDLHQVHSKNYNKSTGTLNFQRPMNGVSGKPVAYKPRQTLFAQDTELKKDVDSLAIRDGISPRRRDEKVHVTQCNGSKPRANSQPFVGERNLKGGAVSSQLRHSPRQTASGPCLSADVHEDPSLLSFAEKTNMFNVRSQSQNDPWRQARASGHVMQSRPMVQGGPCIGPQVVGGLGFDPKQNYAFAPTMRSTIHTTKPCVQPPAPAVGMARMAQVLQQLTPPGPQGHHFAQALHARGRSASPAYTGGAPHGYITAQRHPQVMYVTR